MQGKLITLEGPEGSGKSTQAQRIIGQLHELGIEAINTREPGGTALGEAIRNLLQHDAAGEAPCERAELLLFEASRNQLVETVIRPALERGRWVVCDRFIDSTTAYQGYGRGLPVARVQEINQFAIGGIAPDLTLLLDLEIDTGFKRISRRYRARGEAADRFEREDRTFHENVRQGYLNLARQAPERFRTIDASRASDEVAQEIWKVLTDVFKLSV